MKGAWLQIVVMWIVAQGLAFTQQPDNGSPGTLRFENGSIANGGYSNECLGFSLPIPGGWEMNSQIVGPDGKAKHLPGGGLALLVLHQQKEKAPGSTSALIAQDAAGQAAADPDFVSNAVHAQINAHPDGRELIRDAFAVDYGGNRFYRADYKQLVSDGSTLYLAFVYTKFRGYFIGENLVAGSPEELNESAKSLQQISLGEDQPNSRCVVGGEEAAKSAGIAGGVVGSVLQPSASGRPLRVRVSQGVSTGLLIKKVQPQYPEEARHGRIQGDVVMKVLIDTSGDIRELSLVSGHPLLAQAAMEAVKQWKYKPYLLQGQPVEVETQVVVVFTLSGG